MSGDGPDDVKSPLDAERPVTTHCVQGRVEPATLESLLRLPQTGGARWISASDASTWIASETWAVSRFPGFPRAPPDDVTARSLFAQPRVWLLDYLVPPDEAHPANAHLYLFEGERYSLDDLSKNGRRDARKALRELEIGWITHDQLLAHGLAAFADCRTRNGLSDGTPEHFALRFGPLREVPGYHYIGAWKGDELAAFMTVHAVEQWAWIGAYSHFGHRASCPNDGLIHFALEHCVNERGLRVVSYGLSSVQEQSRSSSLHEFKLKAGFRAVPVRRVFRVHPWLAPLVNRASLRALHGLLRVMPRNRLLKKGSGALAQLLSGSGAGPASSTSE